MIVQGLLLIAVIAVVSGTILTTTLVTAKTALHQTLVAQSRSAMSDATVDFVSWAQARVRAGGAQTSWSPRQTPSLSNDTNEFKPICDATSIPKDGVPACDHWEHNAWMVTGATTPAGQPPTTLRSASPGTTVSNLARTVDEQRISAIISTDIESKDGRHTYASESRQVTARIFDAPPYVVITGVRTLSSINGSLQAAEGDTGGYRQARDTYFNTRSNGRPDPLHPSNLTDTRIVTTVDCVNTGNENKQDPFAVSNHADNLVIDMNRPGDADWAFQMPCDPTYRTPPVPNVGYIEPTGSTYATVDDAASNARLERAATFDSFPL